MLSSFVAFLNKDNFCYERVEQNRELNNNKATHVVYRDNLSKRQNKNKRLPSANHKPENLDDDVNLEKRSSGHGNGNSNSNSTGSNGGVIRVKVKMTKAEANRLLSKCKDGGSLGFREVANELVQIPMNRIKVMCPTTASSTRGSVLQSIPEEL